MVKRCCLVFLVLFISISPALFSEGEIPFTFRIDPNPVGVNDSFSVDIRIPGILPDEVEVPEQELPRGIQTVRGPGVRSVLITDSDGSNTFGTSVTWSFRSGVSGRIPFPGFRINTSRGLLITDPFLLEAGIYKNKKLNIPLELEWMVPHDFVYSGETFPLILVVQNQKEIGLFDSVTVTLPASGIFEEYAGLGTITSIEAGGTVLYQVPAASYLFTPTQGTSVTIPSAKVVQGEDSGNAARLQLEILPLPEEVASTGAVGNFKYAGVLEEKSLFQGDEVLFRVRVTGTGNLNFLRIPEPDFAGAQVAARYEDQDYSPVFEGYRGYREVVYTLKIEEVRELRILLPPFPYLERPSGRIIPSRSSILTFPVTPLDVQGTDNREEERTPLGFLVPEDRLLSILDFQKNPQSVLWLLPGPVVLLLVVLLRKKGGKKTLVLLFLVLPGVWIGSSGFRKEAPETDYESFRELYEAGAYPEVLSRLEAADPILAAKGFHQYNKAAVFRELGLYPQAAVAINLAVRLEPSNRVYREALTLLEKEGQIKSPYPHQWPLNIRLLSLVLIVLVNFLSLLGILFVIRSGGGLIILMILTGGMILADLVMLGMAVQSSLIPRGIVIVCTEEGAPLSPEDDLSPVEDSNGQIYLKRIPRASGENWLPLMCGTRVRIHDRADGYVLVENGENLSGWLPENAILPLAAP